MRSGKKISKTRLNKWRIQNKLRTEGELDPRGNGGSAPKVADQSIPKSLLRIMHLSQTQRLPKKPKLNEYKILTKRDKQCTVNKVTANNHMRYLQRTAMEDCEKHKKADQLQERITAKKEKVEKARAAQSRKPVKVQDLLQLNRQWRREERSEKKQIRKMLRSKKKRGPEDSDEEDFAHDLNGYQEVKFGEVAQRPPKLPSIAKIVEKSKKWKSNKFEDNRGGGRRES